MRLLLATLLALPAIAQAQPATWAILPVGIHEAPNRPTVIEAATATLESTEAVVLQPAQLQARAQALSMPFVPAPAGLAERVIAAEHDVPERHASRQYDRAIEWAEEVMAEVRDHLAAVNRDETLRTKLADLCGYRVRSILEGLRDTTAAALAAQQCFELVPTFPVSREWHPPTTLERLDRARDTLPATLRVLGGEDDPPGCAVRVNGVRIGETPSARVALPAGTYAVQIECGTQPSRVHRVAVETGETSVRVRATLDAALRTEPVSLVYASANALGTLGGDVGELGRALGATRVLAVVEGPAGVTLRTFEVSADQGSARQLREVVLEQPGDEARVRESVAQLATALGDPSGARGGGGGMSPIGPIVLGVGGAAVVVGIILGAVASSQDGTLRSMCPTLMGCDESLRGLNDSTHALGAGADGLWIAGAVIAAVGLVLTFTVTEGSSTTATAACNGQGCSGTLRWIW
ncbi:MAG: PEGA domain-containing protein [Sandaracinaceae bacterium]|nr:PEGA domain-containing protein [Sandaracinaceae bacterium]